MNNRKQAQITGAGGLPVFTLEELQLIAEVFNGGNIGFHPRSHKALTGVMTKLDSVPVKQKFDE